MNFERIEYFCPSCGEKGLVREVLVNPAVLLVRGECQICGTRSAMRAIDLEKLKLTIDLPESHPEPKVWGKVRFQVSSLS